MGGLFKIITLYTVPVLADLLNVFGTLVFF